MSGAERWGYGATATGSHISLGMMKMFWNQIAQPCKYTKKHQIAHFKRLGGMICALYLNLKESKRGLEQGPGREGQQAAACTWGNGWFSHTCLCSDPLQRTHRSHCHRGPSYISCPPSHTAWPQLVRNTTTEHNISWQVWMSQKC